MYVCMRGHGKDVIGDYLREMINAVGGVKLCKRTVQHRPLPLRPAKLFVVLLAHNYPLLLPLPRNNQIKPAQGT